MQRPCSAEPKGEDDPSTKLYSTRNEPLDHKFELLTKHSCAEDESALVKRQHEINQKLKEQLEQASVLVAALKHQLDDTKKGRADALKVCDRFTTNSQTGALCLSCCAGLIGSMTLRVKRKISFEYGTHLQKGEQTWILLKLYNTLVVGSVLLLSAET